jgi:hypothetical protein
MAKAIAIAIAIVVANKKSLNGFKEKREVSLIKLFSSNQNHQVFPIIIEAIGNKGKW